MNLYLDTLCNKLQYQVLPRLLSNIQVNLTYPPLYVLVLPLFRIKWSCFSVPCKLVLLIRKREVQSLSWKHINNSICLLNNFKKSSNWNICVPGRAHAKVTNSWHFYKHSNQTTPRNVSTTKCVCLMLTPQGRQNQKNLRISYANSPGPSESIIFAYVFRLTPQGRQNQWFLCVSLG